MPIGAMNQLRQNRIAYEMYLYKKKSPAFANSTLFPIMNSTMLS